MLDAFSCDIRSIRAQQNIGVHSEAPLPRHIQPQPAVEGKRRKQQDRPNAVSAIMPTSISL